MVTALAAAMQCTFLILNLLVLHIVLQQGVQLGCREKQGASILGESLVPPTHLVALLKLYPSCTGQWDAAMLRNWKQVGRYCEMKAFWLVGSWWAG